MPEATLFNCAIASEAVNRALDMAARAEANGDHVKADTLLTKAINYEEAARERGGQPLAGIPIRIM